MFHGIYTDCIMLNDLTVSQKHLGIKKPNNSVRE